MPRRSVKPEDAGTYKWKAQHSCPKSAQNRAWQNAPRDVSRRGVGRRSCGTGPSFRGSPSAQNIGPQLYIWSCTGEEIIRLFLLAPPTSVDSGSKELVGAAVRNSLLGGK